MEEIFVYGTLIDEKVQRKLIGRTPELSPDILEKYIKKYVVLEGQTYPLIDKRDNNFVEGFVMKINEEELAIFDKYEGSNYKRNKVTLKSRKIVWVYLKP